MPELLRMQMSSGTGIGKRIERGREATLPIDKFRVREAASQCQFKIVMSAMPVLYFWHMSNGTAVIAGASGLVGEFVLNELQRSDYTRVIAPVRRPLIGAGRVENVVGGLDQLEQIKLDPGSDLFCALGTTISKAGSQEAFRSVDYELPLKFAKWGKANGAVCFILVSSVGADASSSNFCLRTKGELERDLEALAFPSLHIFQPSFLVGPRREQRLGERIGIAIVEAMSFALIGGLRKYRSMPAERLAKAMVRTAQSRKPGTNRYKFDEIDGLLS